MEITLEQIELVKDRTGVSYKEAKEALEFANGNVVDAIIYIEDNIDASCTAKENTKVNEFKNLIKDAVNKGNVNRIKVYKGETVLINLPLTAGIVGVVLFRWWGVIAAAFATGVAKCRIELVKEDGTVIDVTEKANDAFSTVKDKGSVIVDEVVDKTGDIYDSVKDKGSDIYEVVKDKGQDIYDAVKNKAEDFLNKNEKEADATVVDAGEEVEENKETEE